MRPKQSDFFIAFGRASVTLPRSIPIEKLVNAELCKKALEKVGNPNVMINMVSRRVRQLNSGGGSLSRPLVRDTTNQGAADIALREIVEDKMGWDLPEPAEVLRPTARKRKKH